MRFHTDDEKEIKEWLPRLLLGGLMGLAIVELGDGVEQKNKREEGERRQE